MFFCVKKLKNCQKIAPTFAVLVHPVLLRLLHRIFGVIIARSEVRMTRRMRRRRRDAVQRHVIVMT